MNDFKATVSSRHNWYTPELAEPVASQIKPVEVQATWFEHRKSKYRLPYVKSYLQLIPNAKEKSFFSNGVSLGAVR